MGTNEGFCSPKIGLEIQPMPVEWEVSAHLDEQGRRMVINSGPSDQLSIHPPTAPVASCGMAEGMELPCHRAY